MKLMPRYVPPARHGRLRNWIVIDDDGSIMAWPDGWLYLFHDPQIWARANDQITSTQTGDEYGQAQLLR